MYDHFDIMGALELVKDDNFFTSCHPTICNILSHVRCRFANDENDATEYTWYVGVAPVVVEFDKHDIAGLLTTAMLSHLPNDTLLLNRKGKGWKVLPKFVHEVEDADAEYYETPFEALYIYWMQVRHKNPRP
jgi:hypothetical protein